MTDERQYVRIADDWYIGADTMNFLLARKRVVGGSGKAKQENVGKEYYEVAGYYSSLSGLLSGLYKQIALEALAEGGLKTLDDYVTRLDERLSRVERLEQEAIRRMHEFAGVEDDE